jgi:hypothetical protein
MQERRTAERVRLSLRTRWETLMTQGRGTVCDLSSTGCFVLSGGEVNPGELTRLEIHFPEGIASVWGAVVYGIAEMGFAIRFKFAGESESRALDKLIASSIER